MTMAYSLYKDLETSLREVQTAYANEQGRSDRLTQKAEDLLKAVAEGQVRERDLRESQRAARDEKIELEAKFSKLEAAVVRWQTAYSTEQVKTKKLTETAKALLGVMEQAQVRLNSLEDGLKVSEREKTRLEVKTKNFETALKRWQTAHAAEQTKNRMLNERSEKLTKIAEKAQDRVHTLEQAEIGRKTKRDFESEWNERSKNWGKGFGRSFKFIFF
jgi:chromosome segregation ATPase